jgi:exopolysaccharide biosynthesis polyprenyl glycosylphosphotransferase
VKQVPLMRTFVPDSKHKLLSREPLPVVHRLPRVAHDKQWQAFVMALVVTDALLLGAAFRLAYVVRFELALGIFNTQGTQRQAYYEAVVAAMILVWLVMFAAMGLYDRQNLLGGTEEYQRLFRAGTYAVLMVIVVGFLVPEFVLARGWLIMSWVLASLIVSLGRFGLRRAIYWLRRRGWFLSPAVIVGANAEGMSLAQQLMAWTTSGLHVVGFVDKKLAPGSHIWNKLDVLGNVDQLDRVIADHGIQEVILASSAFSVRDHLLEVFQRYGVSSRVNLRLSSGLYEIITTGLTVREFAYVPLVGVNKVRLTGLDQLVKFLLDYSLTIVVLILISPLLLLLAMAIKLDSPGPVIYRRRVMGVNGTTFGAYKFRTMQVNGEEILSKRPELVEELARNHKLKDDPRVTRVGRILRRTSLDELPQLFNVLRLEMSLVGPRMIAPEEMAKYDQWAINLLTVKPGITGVWQVSGRSNISYAERVQLDMHYIRNWSIWLDLQLLWQTLPAVLKGVGAY